MRIQTFITLLVVLALVGAWVFVLLPNQAVLDQEITLAGHRSKVSWTIAAAFGLGALLGLGFTITGLGRWTVRRWKSLRLTKRQNAAQGALLRAHEAARIGDHAAAVREYESALDALADPFETHLALGHSLRKLSRFDEAVAAHERALIHEPGSSSARYALALDLLAAGDGERARRELSALLESERGDHPAASRLARDLAIDAGRFEEAERLQNELSSGWRKQHQPATEDVLQGLGIRTELARARAEAGHVRSAQSSLQKILKEDPSFLPARLLLAEVKAANDSIDAARKVLLEGFDAFGEPVLLARLIEIDLQREHPEEAISALRGLVAKAQHKAAARVALGGLYLRLEMLDEAADQWEHLLEESGRSKTVTLLAAETYLRRGMMEKAADFYRDALQSEAGVQRHRCRFCETVATEWSDRCSQCGTFGSLRFRNSDLSEATPKISAPSLDSVYPALD